MHRGQNEVGITLCGRAAGSIYLRVLDGFKTTSAKTPPHAQAAVLDFKLEVGAISEQVTVTAEASLG